ncbi:MAG: radical SAM family heme chaperone HemW [Cyclobacteriaceae bacterium]|nr:radical SAM family heme chaperone HemW [Cyclobacteriaceae bacterium]
MAGIYIHIPFCRQACHYCDFHFSTNRQIESDMITAFEREMELRSEYIGNEEIDTIYLGGGTPSILNIQSLERIFSKINHLFTVTSVAEITLEANPDDLTKEKLLMIKNVGINRLSLGVQTFDDSLLRYLNRAHNSTQALAGFEQARAAGFSNISVDLMYAIPGQTLNGFKKDIEQVLSLNPEHLSAYCLTIEERTAFGHWLKKNMLQPVADEQAADYLELLMDALEASGYEQYEISNFAKPGYYSQHNSSYWKQVTYLGIGPGAHSYNRTSRQANISNNYRYVKSVFAGKIPAETEYLTREEKINEYILTTLRTRWGLDTAKLKADFDFDLIQKNKALLTCLTHNRLAELTNGVIRLTRSGKLLADKIAADFFEVPS